MFGSTKKKLMFMALALGATTFVTSGNNAWGVVETISDKNSSLFQFMVPSSNYHQLESSTASMNSVARPRGAICFSFSMERPLSHSDLQAVLIR